MIVKRSINLIIAHDDESPLVKKLKIIAPITAVISLSIFVLLFLLTLLYNNSNINQFNMLKSEVSETEQKISNSKNTEGIYTLSSVVLSTLGQILNTKKNYSVLLDEILEIEGTGIEISGAKTSSKGGVELTVNASSSASLITLVDKLMTKEQNKKVSDIKASGIIRNKKGQYLLNISFIADKSVLQ